MRNANLDGGKRIKINDLPISNNIKRVLLKSGINELYPPQIKAIECGLFNGKNLIIEAPTASGKTLIAELAITKKLTEDGGKAIYLTPLKALASEKYEDLQKYSEIGIKITISTGDYDSTEPWLKNYDIIVMTNEKADSILRSKPSWINEIKVVIADEIHLLNDPDRGPTLEVVLSRLQLINPRAQLIGLSATIRNSEEIAEWLKAELVRSDWRPVSLKKGVYMDQKIIYEDQSVVEVSKEKMDPCHALTRQTLEEGGQVLIFTNTRNDAKETALKLIPLVSRYIKSDEKRKLMEIADEIITSEETTRISEQLATCIKSGVAFHHAGLSSHQRNTIEKAFREFNIKAICATPTLAAGVNLPARRVIIKRYHRYDSSIGSQIIPILEYHQMSGRAGRPKYDENGDAILIARTEEEKDFLFENYVKAPPERIWSRLASEPALRSHILAIIATDFVKTEEGIIKFLERTFYYHQYGSGIHIRNTLKNVLKFLLENGMIRFDGEYIYSTKLGLRVSELYIDPLSAVYIIDGLKRRSTAAKELAYLHLISTTPDVPRLYLTRRDRRDLLSKALDKKDELLIDVLKIMDESETSYLEALKTAMMLNDWINEEKEDVIIEKYDVGSGDIYMLASTAQWLMYSAAEICKVLGLKAHVGKLEEITMRLEYGCKTELLELVQLRGIGRIRARMLYRAGYRGIEDLRRAKIEDLRRIPLMGEETIKKIKSQIEEDKAI
ncbi:MAG: ATP-dependent DNA helicase [Candidatus Methanomethylicia archaeon]